jgi:lysophospholipase L1-like esterase
MRIFPRIVLLALLASTQIGLAAGDFALHDGDTVVFLGDSITAARGYGKIVENYTLLRFPDRRVRFFNAGHGGDTAAGGLARLELDVFKRGATVLTVAYGINDIDWGVKADEEHKQRYLESIREIVMQCRKRGVRVFICSPAITAEDPDKAERGFLQHMTDEGLALAKAQGADTIDVQRGMREIQRRIWAENARETEPKKKTTLHAEDGVHLNELGQLAMGYVILKGLGAPSDISSAVLDAATQSIVEARGCKISAMRSGTNGFEFVRLDEGLPLNLGILGALQFRFIPIPENLDRYMLAIRNLPPGDYEILAEGRLLGTTTARQLAAGLNICSMTADGWEPGGPWDAQAGVIKEITDARHQLAIGDVLRTAFLPTQPGKRDLERQIVATDKELVALQRKVAKPFPYHFLIRARAQASLQPPR